jgi:cardiolipin synthase
MHFFGVLILSHLVLLIGVLMAVSMVARINREQRSPAGAIAWLLIIVLAPYIGVPLYLILGGRKMARAAGTKAELSMPQRNYQIPTELEGIDRLFRSLNMPGVTTGNRVRLCQNGEEIYRDLLDLIDRAERTIHITTFILAVDEVGREVVRRLARRAAEGLDVRLLLDAVGSIKANRRFLSEYLEAGGKVAYFMPVLATLFKGRSNLRNHRKIVVVDERWALAGGTNIAIEYIGPEPLASRWRDLSFVLEGPAARDFERVFAADWTFAGGEPYELSPQALGPVTDGDESEAVVQVVPSGPDVPGDYLYDAILTAIFSARDRLWIATPYFVPDQTLLKALMIAAHRGVDVSVVVPEKSNHRLVDVAGRQALRELEQSGGRVLGYQPGMMHAKVMLVDHDLAIIGSANMDMRSLLLNYEVVMFAYSQAEVDGTEAWIDTLRRKSKPMPVSQVSPPRDFGEGLVRMLAPLL